VEERMVDRNTAVIRRIIFSEISLDIQVVWLRLTYFQTWIFKMTFRIVFPWCETFSLFVGREFSDELKVSESKVLIGDTCSSEE
jgi:hypothetical protein